MSTRTRRIGALALSIALVSGVAACDNLPEIDPSRLPDISIPALPSGDPDPQPTETVTEEPGPAPTETVTEEPEPEPEPSATAAPEPEPDEDAEPFVWWPWAVAAAVLLIILIIWARWAGKRRAWDRRLEAAGSELSWIEDSLIPQILAKPSAAEASQLWQAAQQRVLDLDRRLHDLSESAPNDRREATAERGLQVLGDLTAAVDAETSTQAGTDADQLRARRAAIDAARAQARTWVEAIGR